MADKPWTVISNKEHGDGTVADKVSPDNMSVHDIIIVWNPFASHTQMEIEAASGRTNANSGNKATYI